jgi:hypothetical protein
MIETAPAAARRAHQAADAVIELGQALGHGEGGEGVALGTG